MDQGSAPGVFRTNADRQLRSATASTASAAGPFPHHRANVAATSSSTAAGAASRSSALSTALGLGLSPTSSPLSLSPAGAASISPPPSEATASGTVAREEADSFVVNMSFQDENNPHHRHHPQVRGGAAAVAAENLSVALVDLESGGGAPTMSNRHQQQIHGPHEQQPLQQRMFRMNTQQQQQQHQQQQQQQQNANNNNNNSNNEWGDDTSFSSMLSHLLEHNPELREIATAMEKYIKFFLLLFAKLMFDHGTGIVTFGGLLLTFYNANSVVRQQVARQARRNSLALFAVLVNLVACIGFICYVFADEKIYNCAIFLPPSKVDTLYDLLWFVAVNDFMLKFLAVILKIGLVFTPGQLVPYQKRGKYFLFLERCSQLHRELVPIQLWLIYLLNGYERIPGKVMGVILVAVYMVFKGKSLIARGRAFKVACEKLMQSRSFGRSPSPEQLKASGSGGSCPICYDDYRSPTLLHCKHIFCEECLITWFDRERTCPMCRAQVTDDPEWRDGATSFFIQLY